MRAGASMTPSTRRRAATARRSRRRRGGDRSSSRSSSVLLFTLMFGIINFGLILSFKQDMTRAAAEGARAGAVAFPAPPAAQPAAPPRRATAIKAIGGRFATSTGCDAAGMTCTIDPSARPAPADATHQVRHRRRSPTTTRTTRSRHPPARSRPSCPDTITATLGGSRINSDDPPPHRRPRPRRRPPARRASCCPVLLLMTAFAVDLGRQRSSRRTCRPGPTSSPSTWSASSTGARRAPISDRPRHATLPRRSRPTRNNIALAKITAVDWGTCSNGRPTQFVAATRHCGPHRRQGHRQRDDEATSSSPAPAASPARRSPPPDASRRLLRSARSPPASPPAADGDPRPLLNAAHRRRPQPHASSATTGCANPTIGPRRPRHRARARHAPTSCSRPTSTPWCVLRRRSPGPAARRRPTTSADAASSTHDRRRPSSLLNMGDGSDHVEQPVAATPPLDGST